MKWLVRGSIPIAAILVPAAFFLSVLSPDAKAPNGLIYLAYVGALLLALGVLVLGIGLVRRQEQAS
jgi:ABC-type multidrug transport system permease subunit